MKFSFTITLFNYLYTNWLKIFNYLDKNIEFGGVKDNFFLETAIIKVFLQKKYCFYSSSKFYFDFSFKANFNSNSKKKFYLNSNNFNFNNKNNKDKDIL